MSMQTLTKNLDKGYYKQAAGFRSEDGDRISTMQYLGEHAKYEGVYPTLPQLKDAEEFWLGRLRVQPHEFERREKVKEYAYDEWVLCKIFEDAGCPIRGRAAVNVQKAFTTNTTQVLFPFFYDTNIVAGILASPVLDRLIMEDIPVQSHTADHLEMTEGVGDRSMGLTGEGATFVQLTIRSTNRPVTLKKFGAVLLVTYEAMRLARLPLLARFLQRLGRQYQNDITDLAIETLIAGDGAGAGAIASTATTVPGSPTYSDLVRTELAFGMGYMPNTIVAPKETIQDFLLFSEFKDPLAGILHQVNGSYPTPVGMNLVRWDVTGKATSYLTTHMIMLDNDIALVKYTEGGIIQESDRIIDGQWEQNTVSSWCGFGIMDRASSRLGTGW